jgi:circadian clock protein KaiC
VMLHPRTELVYDSPPIEPIEPRTRLSLGVPRLDEMLGGGLLSQSTSMLLGAPGSGKTVLGLHFLAAGARAGEPSLYFGLSEKPGFLTQKADQLGLGFSQLVEQGGVHVHWEWPRQEILDIYAERIINAVQRYNIRRVFIDGLNGFRHVVYPERVPAVFNTILDELRGRGVTTLYTAEMQQVIGTEIELPIHNISAATDNIILLRYLELRSQLYRLISILKQRDSGYDSAIREFVISSSGIDVASTFSSAETILTGVAQPLPEASSKEQPKTRPVKQRPRRKS